MKAEVGVKFIPVCDMKRLGVYMVHLNGFGCDLLVRWFYDGYLQSKFGVVLAAKFRRGNLSAYDLVYAYQFIYI